MWLRKIKLDIAIIYFSAGKFNYVYVSIEVHSDIYLVQLKWKEKESGS